MDLDFFLTVGCLCALSRDFQLSIVFFLSSIFQRMKSIHICFAFFV